MLRHIINEPGPTHYVYNHIVRELLGIAPGTTMNNLLLARLRGHQDTISLKYFIMDLDRDSNYNWIYSLEADGLIDEMQLDELLIIDSYLNFMQNRTGLICNGYADITKCTRDDFVKFTKWADAIAVVYDEKEASVAQDRDAVTTTIYPSIWYVTNITDTKFLWST